MPRNIIMVPAFIAIGMGLGALLALWRCSRRRWCPRYLQRQLDAWRAQLKKQNDIRRRKKMTGPATTRTDNEDEAA